MQIRILREEEIANAAGLSRYVFDTCLRNRMEYVQTIGFVEEYLKAENIQKLCKEGVLTLWGVFEQEQLLAVSGMQNDGLITMLYVLPQCVHRRYGASLLKEMKLYAKETYNYEKVMVNATPAWTAMYFKKQGFHMIGSPADMHVPYIAMLSKTTGVEIQKKRHVSANVIAAIIAGCIAFGAVTCVLFTLLYLL